jgi:hypothetical protein
MMERRFEDALDRGPSSERRLCTGRARAPARLDLARIAVPPECRQLSSRRVPERSLYGLRGALSQLTDGHDADLGEPRLGGGAHAPHERHGQFVKELEFSIWIDDDQSIRLREPVGLADEVVADKGFHSRAVVLELSTASARTSVSPTGARNREWIKTMRAMPSTAIVVAFAAIEASGY